MMDDAIKERVVADYASGYGPSLLAKRYGLTRAVVVHLVRRAGVARSHREACELIRQPPKDRTPSETEKRLAARRASVAAMYLDGATLESIASKHGVRMITISRDLRAVFGIAAGSWQRRRATGSDSTPHGVSNR